MIETATVTARMANGVLACSVFSERTIARNELEIYGESRCMRIDCYRFDGLEHASSLNHPGGLKDRVQSIGRTLRAFPLGVSGLRYGGDFVDSYRTEWRHFIDAIRTNTPVESTLEDGRSALQVALAVVKSISTGQPVKVPAQASRAIEQVPTRENAFSSD
ncbi:MAG: Gfo/Idh/MocA family oxidoreductase [Candidatus Binatia bacterium]